MFAYEPVSRGSYKLSETKNTKIYNPENRFYFRTADSGGSAEDWRWAGKENPYPNDEIMSEIAFMFYMNNTVNRQYGYVSRAVYYEGERFVYYVYEREERK